MPIRGRLPPVLVMFILAFALMLLVGFQIVKEWRIASANISEKEFQLDSVFEDLREQVKLAQEREKERDSAQAKLLEVERVSLSAQDSLHEKDSELANMRSQHERTAEELLSLKKVVKQKEDEIVHIREQLQGYSFEKAKESAEQTINNVMESTLENRQAEEHKPADEAGLDDRKRLQDEEEAIKEGEVSTTEKEHVSATEKEMDERSKPKPNVLNEGRSAILGDTEEKGFVDNIEELSKLDGHKEAESHEQDISDMTELDEKENQEEDLHEITKLEAALQAGNHEDADALDADHPIE